MPGDIFTNADLNDLMAYALTFPPVLIGWNRLEARPRTADYDRALRAEVRDALWFLTRQWQFGEFAGEDAGSPVDARTSVRTDPLQHYAIDRSKAIAYSAAMPLETRVEHEDVVFDLTLHAQVTRVFWGLLAGATNPTAIRKAYLQHYPLTRANLPGRPGDDDVTERALVLGGAHTVNARTLVDDLRKGLHDGVVDTFGLADAALMKAAGAKLLAWFEAQFSVPGLADPPAWRPRFLEYQFAVATDTVDRGQTVLAADQYAHGRLDWFAFDIDAAPGAALTRGDGSAATPTPASGDPLSFIPTPVVFGGMPSHRYWEMENRQIEFADIDANTTDVAKLLLTEFALVYGNDWCVIPYELPVGSVNEVVGILVGDTFGEQSLLLPAGRGFDDTWQRWSMFTLSRTPSTAETIADTRFFLPPALPKLLEAPPLEKVLFLRDEMANMAWAVERVVPSGLGHGINGYTVATRASQTVPTPPPLHATTAPVRYVLGTDVPYNWIPFIPVHITGSNRSVQLQRARMPQDAGAASRRQRTAILTPPTEDKKYFLNEEEVPRAGAQVTRGYQRARWLDGRTFTWIGRRTTTGRGEGSSGLAFDLAVPVEKPKT
jgi:hypothetical protein